MSDIYYECDEGWHPLIKRTVAELREVDPDIEFLQIKEKFGELRIYVYPNRSDEVDDILHNAEVESLRTCEICGNPGTLSKKGWWKTLCAEHTPND